MSKKSKVPHIRREFPPNQSGRISGDLYQVSSERLGADLKVRKGTQYLGPAGGPSFGPCLEILESPCCCQGLAANLWLGPSSGAGSVRLVACRIRSNRPVILSPSQEIVLSVDLESLHSFLKEVPAATNVSILTNRKNKSRRRKP